MQEADWAREFLLSLQSMYAEALPPGTAPHQQQQYDVHGSLDAAAMLAATRNPNSSLRAVGHQYCSALLQALTADTSDLQDMYAALFSCLQVWGG